MKLNLFVQQMYDFKFCEFLGSLLIGLLLKALACMQLFLPYYNDALT